VFPVASVGSTISVPMAFEAKLPEMKSHLGSPSSALSVRQMPPPAAATQSRHDLSVQLGAIAIAVTRPEVL
jgi:hypothetical protein